MVPGGSVCGSPQGETGALFALNTGCWPRSLAQREQVSGCVHRSCRGHGLISLVRRNGCLPAPCGQENPSGQKQIKAHTLQIGGLPQLARRLEFSAALIEKSLSFLLPISLSPCCKRKSHLLQPSGRPLSSRSVPGWRLPGSEKKDQPGAGVWGGGLRAWASISLPHPSRLRCAQ